ncbi:MAG: flavin reductase family protein [Leucobacter sp.]
MDNQSETRVDPEAFKDAFRLHPAGIALVTASTPEGPVGLTASSVASVALAPMALAFSVTRATGSAGGILEAPSYLVHLLDLQHAEMAKVFARSGTERFTHEQGWETLPTGEPYLPTVRVALRCESLQVTPVGSSSLVLAGVLEILTSDDVDSLEPLVYYDRAFQTL